jgi:hypothetical protein
VAAGNQSFAQEYRPMNLQKIADLIGETMLEAHRGVIYLTGGDFLAFGNDSHATDERSKRSVEAARRHIADRATEVGFATSGDGYSWVMLLQMAKDYATQAGREAFRSLLTSAMWDGFGDSKPGHAGSIRQVQEPIAEVVIGRARPWLLELLAAT